MERELQFLEKLNGLLSVAKANGQKITIEEVKTYFGEENLTKEQMELVFDYLLSQKVVVQGYLKINSANIAKEEVFTEEDKRYLKEYLSELDAMKPEAEGEKENLFEQVICGDDMAKARLTELYLQEVVKIAKEMKKQDVFLGDLVQEGNVGLLGAIHTLDNAVDAHKEILLGIRQAMQMFLEECSEMRKQDEKMVEKVTALEESITALTEELGRKASVEELAVYTGMEEEELYDILKLLGEEMEEDEV